MISKIRKNILAFVLAMTVTAAGAASADTLINGAGATFPYPLYSKWFSEYAKVDPSVKFNYQSIGSGGGIKQITAQTVDFGASDKFLSDDELQERPLPAASSSISRPSWGRWSLPTTSPASPRGSNSGPKTLPTSSSAGSPNGTTNGLPMTTPASSSPTSRSSSSTAPTAAAPRASSPTISPA